MSRKKVKWKNKTRILVINSCDIGFRGHHLLQDIQSMTPHSKTDSKMQRKESLFDINEIAEMKNCEKCLLFEGRKGKDVYMWASNVPRGPSIKFEVIRYLLLDYYYRGEIIKTAGARSPHGKTCLVLATNELITIQSTLAGG